MHYDASNRWGSFNKKVQVLAIDRQSIMVFEAFAGGCQMPIFVQIMSSAV